MNRRQIEIIENAVKAIDLDTPSMWLHITNTESDEFLEFMIKKYQGEVLIVSELTEDIIKTLLKQGLLKKRFVLAVSKLERNFDDEFIFSFLREIFDGMVRVTDDDGVNLEWAGKANIITCSDEFLPDSLIKSRVTLI
jgi:hypothetical protein